MSGMSGSNGSVTSEVGMYVFICAIFAWVYACMYVCMCVCMCVCVYVLMYASNTCICACDVF